MTLRLTSPTFSAIPMSLSDIRGIGGQEVQGLVEEGVDRRVLHAEHARMVRVSRHALDAVLDELLQAAHVAAELLDLAADGSLASRSRNLFHGPAGLARGFLIELAGPLLHGLGALDPVRQAGGVEIDVGDRGEEGFDHESVDVAVRGAQALRPVRVAGDAQALLDKLVHMVGRGRLLAADSDLSDSPCRPRFARTDSRTCSFSYSLPSRIRSIMRTLCQRPACLGLDLSQASPAAPGCSVALGEATQFRGLEDSYLGAAHRDEARVLELTQAAAQGLGDGAQAGKQVRP